MSRRLLRTLLPSLLITAFLLCSVGHAVISGMSMSDMPMHEQQHTGQRGEMTYQDHYAQMTSVPRLTLALSILALVWLLVLLFSVTAALRLPVSTRFVSWLYTRPPDLVRWLARNALSPPWRVVL